VLNEPIINIGKIIELFLYSAFEKTCAHFNP
jgi:hypothetical protein